MIGKRHRDQYLFSRWMDSLWYLTRWLLRISLWLVVAHAGGLSSEPTTTPSTTTQRRVAIVTGGSRGIGRGIVEALIESGEYDGLLITYNTNSDAAETLRTEIGISHPTIQVELVGGDLSLRSTRDSLFECLDDKFHTFDLCLMVHNAGQYLGITSENSHGLEAMPDGQSPKFGDGSLLNSQDGTLIMDSLQFYHKLYGEAYIDLCERSIMRMKRAYDERNDDDEDPYRGCLIGISSPGCNHNFPITTGYDLPGSGKCVMEFVNRYLAVRVAPYNINSNIIIPGFTRSDAWNKIAEERRRLAGGGGEGETTMSPSTTAAGDVLLEQMKGMIPMKQIMEAKELGSVVTFLASKRGGGRFLTGLSLRVDGGLHLR